MCVMLAMYNVYIGGTLVVIDLSPADGTTFVRWSNGINDYHGEERWLTRFRNGAFAVCHHVSESNINTCDGFAYPCGKDEDSCNGILYIQVRLAMVGHCTCVSELPIATSLSMAMLVESSYK